MDYICLISDFYLYHCIAEQRCKSERKDTMAKPADGATAYMEKVTLTYTMVDGVGMFVVCAIQCGNTLP